MDFKLIMVFVDDTKTDRVLDASRAAGATGATIVGNARGQGLHKLTGIFGLEILEPRDVVLILVEQRRAEKVLHAVLEAGQLDETLSTGIALQLDVERALGLSEHISALSRHHPINQEPSEP
ncbi:transcriptional regulator [Thiocapsa imhoffii]|uniref:Transcriptional regulator n=2 Tax=Thiocapsa imhoffii TaxID=382777 RepID=A0A9X1BB40_9GAMM|nr:transcriptional regulator [Thiocapsa imhoffii]